MSTYQPGDGDQQPEYEYTRRIQLGQQGTAPAAGAPPEYDSRPPYAEHGELSADGQPFPNAEAHAAAPDPILYVPLAVTVGDGFKFGCGFFLASVVTMLVAFVLVAALFALSSLVGINLPVGR